MTVRKKDLFRKSQNTVPYSSKKSFHVGLIEPEPLAPVKHRADTGIILRIRILRCYDAIEHTADNLRFIMLVRKQYIRKFIMIAFARVTSKSADTQILPFSTFLFSDSESGITVPKRPTTTGASGYLFTAYNQNTSFLIAKKRIL